MIIANLSRRMKSFFSVLSFLLAVSVMRAEEAPENDGANYIAEAPLPEGWPEPGPFDEVARKSYPVYRAATVDAKERDQAFWKLFQHIQSNGIPMTAPVEMGMKTDEERFEMESMAFLYQNVDVGSVGEDGQAVQVKDSEPMNVVTYAFNGQPSGKRLKAAKAKIDSYLVANKLSASSYRLLGYNGPGIPDAEKTYELQAILASD